MFDETKKYKNWGHFFYTKNNNLKEVSQDVPNLQGVYYIIRLARGRVELVYIGKSGDNSPINGLQESINTQPNGIPRQAFFDRKMTSEKIDGLDIYWFVTVDKDNNDLPSEVESLLMERYREVNGQAPLWNKET